MKIEEICSGIKGICPKNTGLSDSLDSPVSFSEKTLFQFSRAANASGRNFYPYTEDAPHRGGCGDVVKINRGL